MAQVCAIFIDTDLREVSFVLLKVLTDWSMLFLLPCLW